VRLTQDATVKALDGARGIIEGIANVGNIKDLQGDTVLPGAWSRVIRDFDNGEQAIPFVWGHNVEQVDARGRITRLEELPVGSPLISANQKGARASGLYFQAQMSMSSNAGREAYALISDGAVKSTSVQFVLGPGGSEPDGDGGRLIKSISKLIEISGVIVPASPGSMILSAKSYRRPSLAELYVEAVAERWEREELRQAIKRDVRDAAARMLVKAIEARKERERIEKAAGLWGQVHIAQPQRRRVGQFYHGLLIA
jgi:HK97 family phage prohead protease